MRSTAAGAHDGPGAPAPSLASPSLLVSKSPFSMSSAGMSPFSDVVGDDVDGPGAPASPFGLSSEVSDDEFRRNSESPSSFRRSAGM
eukprot:scaffold21632_cov101-Isochrysis_galbana.AAC.2